MTRAHHTRRRDDNEPEIVEALRAVGATVELQEAAGVPDLLVGWCKNTFLLEVKRQLGPRGGDQSEMTVDQLKWWALWKGRTPSVVRTANEALLAIGATDAYVSASCVKCDHPMSKHATNWRCAVVHCDCEGGRSG